MIKLLVKKLSKTWQDSIVGNTNFKTLPTLNIRKSRLLQQIKVESWQIANFKTANCCNGNIYEGYKSWQKTWQKPYINIWQTIMFANLYYLAKQLEEIKIDVTKKSGVLS